MNRANWPTGVVIVTLALAACGGSDSDSSDANVPPAPDAQDTDETPSTQPDVESDTETTAAPANESVVDVPVARFAAHGPGEPNTFGSHCSVGIDDRGGDVFRFTAPESWTWKGTSGGSGYDEVSLTADDATMIVTEAAYDYDTEIITGWAVTGPSGADITIDGETIPIMEVTVEGAIGYAIVDLPYLAPLPGVGIGAALGTVALTSDTPGRPTLDEAVQLLETVRVERCAVIGEAMIWGPTAGTRLVPRFEPDPLGKTYPDQPQPTYDPVVTPLDAYTLEQVAYLLPIEADAAMCAATKVVEFGAGNPIAYLLAFVPSGTGRADFEAVVEGC